MEWLYKKIMLLAVCVLSLTANATDFLNTSFETSDGFTAGNTIKNIGKWTVTSGSAVVSTDSKYVNSGSQGVALTSTTTKLQADYVAYSTSETGYAGVFYVDFYIKINTLNAIMSVTLNDLTSSAKRLTALEINTAGKFKFYNGSSGAKTQPAYTKDKWTRISMRVNPESKTYRACIDGQLVDDMDYALRESRSDDKQIDFHSLRFQVNTAVESDFSLDDVYVGTTAPTGVSFGEEKQYYTLTIQQPTTGTISVQPQQDRYEAGTSVKLTMSVPGGYAFDGWQGFGSEPVMDNPYTFAINDNMTVTASCHLDDGVREPKEWVISTVNEFRELVRDGKAIPGDIITLRDGTYNAIGSIKVGCTGTEDKPIIIRSQNPLGAKLTGTFSATIVKKQFITFEGLDIDVAANSTIFKLEGCNNIRVTRCNITMAKASDTQTSKWIQIGDSWDATECTSHHNRIDHNLIYDKKDGGALLIIDGSHGIPDISKHDRIDHNIFRNNGPRQENEKETVRIGVSDLTQKAAYTVVEYNLFDNCDGDPEIVSVKSCCDTIRYNTFFESLGTLSLRQGNASVVEGNYFLGNNKTAEYNGGTIGCGGVRVYGLDHKVINNYMYGLTGSRWDAGIVLTNGEVDNTSTSYSSHFIPENVVFTNNTLVDCESDIEIGYTNGNKYGKAPKNCLIANNIIYNPGKTIVTSYSDASLAGVSFSNNIAYYGTSGSMGISASDAQLKNVDPLLVLSDKRCETTGNSQILPTQLYKLSASSPAIDAGNDATILIDMECQGIAGSKRDIGADEFNNFDEVLASIITSNLVGPSADDNITFETPSETTGIESLTSGSSSKGVYGDGSIYDLQGRKVVVGNCQLPKGIYIKQGKKIIIK